MTSPTTVEVPKKARARAARGWAVRSHSSIINALFDASYGLSAATTAAAMNFLYAALRDLWPGGSVTDWEEFPGRTQSEVLALMDRAIALASEKEAGHVG